MADQIISIISVAGMPEAEILRGLLEAEGISVWLSHESAGTAIGLAVGRLGRVDLYINQRDQERAKALLDSFFAEELDDDNESSDKASSS
jgi:hypothetical protein